MAATPGHATAQLDTVVVTGTRTQRDINDAPVRTEVVSRHDIENSHARSVKQALEQVPGLQLTRIRGKAGFEVSMQGLGSDRVLVLIDGLPVTASTGSSVDLSQIDLTDVQRIEVVKGAMSAQYGSAAMGGVINIITQSPQRGLAGTLQADGGSYGKHNPSGVQTRFNNRHLLARIEGGSQAWRFRVNGDLRDSDGIDPDPATWPQAGDSSKRRHGSARLEWHPDTDSRLFFQGGRLQEDSISRYQQQLPGFRVDHKQLETATRDRFSGGGSWQWQGGTQLQLSAVNEAYRDHTVELAAGSLFANRVANLGMQHASAIVDLPMLGAHLLQMGADYHRETLRQQNSGTSDLDHSGTVSRNTREVFIQDDIFINDSWELLPGLRYQYDSDFGAHAAPKVNLRTVLLKRPGLTASMRAGWGSGYRVPNLKERHFRFDHSELGYVVIGNPDLQPETSSNWQLGWNLDLGGTVNLDLSLFSNHLRNLIQVDEANAPVVNGISQFRYRNIARARTRGGEVTAHWRTGARLDLTAGYTYTQTRDLNSGSELTRQPHHQARITVDWQVLEQTTLSARARAQGRELIDSTSQNYSPGWIQVDVSINHDLTPQLRVFAGIDNLFAEQRDFTDSNDFRPVAGRFGYLGLRYRWGH